MNNMKKGCCDGSGCCGDGWVELDDLTFNGRRKTVSFWVNNFTCYGWAY
ncbi:MAG: hypothetical protein IIB40_08440 [Candidatus Marinimicrobia bacterium]|nr:hypothetical protein [Candidatus Neomarinimicrobiota bacterium]